MIDVLCVSDVIFLLMINSLTYSVLSYQMFMNLFEIIINGNLFCANSTVLLFINEHKVVLLII